MCYSATASFVAAGALTVIGTLTQKNRKVAPHQQLVGNMPFIFAVQQFAEGITWLGVMGAVPEWASTTSMQIYVAIAFTLWPIYVPMAIAKYNKITLRPRNISGILLIILLIIGIILGAYLLWSVTAYSQLRFDANCSYVGCDSLSYRFYLPFWQNQIEYIYFFPAVIPFFLCKSTRIRFILAPLYLISFPVGIYFSTSETLPSVWCFIAALISATIYFMFQSTTVKNSYGGSTQNCNH